MLGGSFYRRRRKIREWKAAEEARKAAAAAGNLFVVIWKILYVFIGRVCLSNFAAEIAVDDDVEMHSLGDYPAVANDGIAEDALVPDGGIAEDAPVTDGGIAEDDVTHIVNNSGI